MVVDTSIVLAVLFDERHAAWAVEQLTAHASDLRMSTVNLAECLIRIRDRQPHLGDDIAEELLTSGIRFVAPDVEHATLAAEARMRYPLNLGDCFAYALARVEGMAVLTLDRDFRALDVPVILPPGA